MPQTPSQRKTEERTLWMGWRHPARRDADVAGAAGGAGVDGATAGQCRLTGPTPRTRPPRANRMAVMTATTETRREPVLPDDGNRLLERRPAHRPRVREDRRRCDRPISSAAR